MADELVYPYKYIWFSDCIGTGYMYIYSHIFHSPQAVEGINVLHLRTLSILLTGILLFAQSAAAEEKEHDSGRLEVFRNLVSDSAYQKVLARLQHHPNATVQFVWRNLCASQKGSFAWSLDATTSRTYERANAFAETMQKCPNYCTPRINKAEFCGYVRGRKLEIQALKTWDKGFFEASNLLQNAIQHARLPEEQLSIQARRIISPALELLRQSLIKTTINKSEVKLTVQELQDMKVMLSVLANAGILEGDVPLIKSTLKGAISTLSHTGDNSDNPTILQAAADLIWLIRMLDTGADIALRTVQQKPNTTAAGPRAILFGQERWMSKATTCLNRLSLDASTAKSGIQSELELLESCRNSSPCSSAQLQRQPTISKLLNIVEMSFKEQLAITGSMCKQKKHP